MLQRNVDIPVITAYGKCGIIKCILQGQVDFPELPEMLKITEMTENFTKVTKYKETLINYFWEKSDVKKQ